MPSGVTADTQFNGKVASPRVLSSGAVQAELQAEDDEIAREVGLRSSFMVWFESWLARVARCDRLAPKIG